MTSNSMIAKSFSAATDYNKLTTALEALIIAQHLDRKAAPNLHWSVRPHGALAQETPVHRSTRPRNSLA